MHQIVGKLPAFTAVDETLGAGRLNHRGRARKTAIALVLMAVLGVGALALSVDLRARLIVPGDGHLALEKVLIWGLRGL